VYVGGPQQARLADSAVAADRRVRRQARRRRPARTVARARCCTLNLLFPLSAGVLPSVDGPAVSGHASHLAAWMMVLSWMLVNAPTMIVFRSARSTQPYHMLTCGAQHTVRALPPAALPQAGRQREERSATLHASVGSAGARGYLGRSAPCQIGRSRRCRLRWGLSTCLAPGWARGGPAV